MTSVALAQLLIRRTAWATPSEMPAADLNALAVCMNQAFQRWFEKANITHTAQSQTRHLRGQVQLTGTATNGSTAVTLTSPPSWLAAEGIGSTVRLSGDSRYNRLLAIDRLMLPYSGATGTVNIILDHDCGHLGSDSVRTCSEVHVHYNNYAWPLSNGKVPLAWSGEGYKGRPEVYDIEPLNPGAGAEPAMVLRVWPLVTTPSVLTFTLSKHFSVTLPDLLAPRALPFAEDVASGIIYPIALDFAAGEGLLTKAEPADLARIRANAADAIARIHTRTMNPVSEVEHYSPPDRS